MKKLHSRIIKDKTYKEFKKLSSEQKDIYYQYLEDGYDRETALKFAKQFY